MNFDPSVITDHWRFLAYGVGVTIALAAASGAVSLALGFLVALARLFGPRWAKPAVVPPPARPLAPPPPPPRRPAPRLLPPQPPPLPAALFPVPSLHPRSPLP